MNPGNDSGAGAADGERPNVVLVTVDSLRADHCGHWGYERETTPALDRLAGEGLVFENAIAPGPATPESMPAVLTGQYPVGRGAGRTDLRARRDRIRRHVEARHTLAERFRARGYSTAAFTPNPFTSRQFGFDAGFDRFEDFMDDSTDGLYRRIFGGFLDGSPVASMARVLRNVWRREEVFKPWQSYYDAVLDWTERASEPYFLWVFLMDAHNPYLSAAPHRTQARWKALHANVEFWRQSHETPFSDRVHDRLVTAYDDAVRYSDAFLRRLRHDLAGDDPVIAVHGDHGEAFGEHGSYGHEPYLHPENVHVPLVVGGAGVGAGRHDPPVSLRHLSDALCALAAGGDVRDPLAARPAVTRTEDGAAVAEYRADGITTASLDADPADASADGGLSPALARHLASERERTRLASAAEPVAGESV